MPAKVWKYGTNHVSWNWRFSTRKWWSRWWWDLKVMNDILWKQFKLRITIKFMRTALSLEYYSIVKCDSLCSFFYMKSKNFFYTNIERLLNQKQAFMAIWTISIGLILFFDCVIQKRVNFGIVQFASKIMSIFSLSIFVELSGCVKHGFKIYLNFLICFQSSLCLLTFSEIILVCFLHQT